MDEEQQKSERYKICIDLLKFEGQMLWQIMTPFMVVNGILLAFISNKVEHNFTDLHHNLACFYAGLFGIILIIPWWGTFVRNTYYYHFRMDQAKSDEPVNWKILNEAGKKFADGGEVIVNEVPHQIPPMGIWMSNKKACQWLIFGFAIIYIALIIAYCPPFDCK